MNIICATVTPISHTKLLVTLLLLSSLELLAGDQSFCSSYAKSVYVLNSTYSSNLKSLAEALIAQVTDSQSHSANGTAGTGPDKVYGIVLCRGDSTSYDCAQRLKGILDAGISSKKASNSESSQDNIITLFDDWYQAQITFFNQEYASSFRNAPKCIVTADLNPPQSTTANSNKFDMLVSKMMTELTDAVVSQPGRYATGQGWFNDKDQTVYGLLQCIEDMPPEGCRACLNSLTADREHMVGSGQMGGAILGVRCSLWYQTDVHFFTGTSTLSLHMPTRMFTSSFVFID